MASGTGATLYYYSGCKRNPTLNEAQIVTLVTSALDAKEARKPVSRKEND